MQKEIGRRLKRFRAEKKLTQKELAARVSGGVDYTYIGKIERGEQLPSLKVLVKISETLDVPVESFFRDEAVLLLADPRLQRLARGKWGPELLSVLTQLHEDDMPLAVELMCALKRNRSRSVHGAALLAAEEPPPYGEKE